MLKYVEQERNYSNSSIIILNFVCYFFGTMKKNALFHIALISIAFLTLCHVDIFGINMISILNCNKKSVHPVHISYTHIEYNNEKGKFEILFKLFVDDFDLILQAKYGKDLKLKEGIWDKSYIETINKYIFEHFKFIIGTKDKTLSGLKFNRTAISDGAIWLYYDFSSKKKSNTFEIYNSLMTDIYPDQTNLLLFTYLDKQKTFRFDISKIKEGFSID